MSLEIIVYGQPAPQGSKRHVGNGRMVEMSKRVKPWRDDVKAAAETKLTTLDFAARLTVPLDGPLAARMVFTVARPASHYRTGRNAHLLRDSAPRRPASMPDLSKLVRSTEDALTAAGVWHDDARVVEYERVAKVYIGEDREAIDRPGARITVRVIDPADQPVDRPEGCEEVGWLLDPLPVTNDALLAELRDLIRRHDPAPATARPERPAP